MNKNKIKHVIILKNLIYIHAQHSWIHTCIYRICLYVWMCVLEIKGTPSTNTHIQFIHERAHTQIEPHTKREQRNPATHGFLHTNTNAQCTGTWHYPRQYTITHTITGTHTNTHTHRYPFTYTNSCTCRHAPFHIPLHTHTHTDTSTHAHRQPYTDTLLNTPIYKRKPLRKHTHINT